MARIGGRRRVRASLAVIPATGYVLFYGLVAALSPLAFTATLLVIRSERRRTNGLAFLAGYLGGTTIAGVLGLVLGQAAVDGLDAHEDLLAVLALVLGIVLVAVGLVERRSPTRPRTAGGRGGAILAGLERVGPGAASSMAGLLGFGGPKRLVLTFLAMASISVADLRDVGTLALLVLYVAIATVLVSVPVGLVVVAGDRGAAIIGRGESWLTSHSAAARTWLALGLGLALVADGLVRLTG